MSLNDWSETDMIYVKTINWTLMLFDKFGGDMHVCDHVQ